MKKIQIELTENEIQLIRKSLLELLEGPTRVTVLNTQLNNLRDKLMLSILESVK
jgi:hypothetical protein